MLVSMRRYNDGWGREQSESSKKLINSRIVEVVGQDSRLRSVLERLTEYEGSLVISKATISWLFEAWAMGNDFGDNTRCLRLTA